MTENGPHMLLASWPRVGAETLENPVYYTRLHRYLVDRNIFLVFIRMRLNLSPALVGRNLENVALKLRHWCRAEVGHHE